MDGVAGLLTAGATFLTALVGAIILLVRELRRNPRKADRIAMLLNLLSRTRDWYQDRGYEDKLPRSLRTDINRVLDDRPEGSETDSTRTDRGRDDE